MVYVKKEPTIVFHMIKAPIKGMVIHGFCIWKFAYSLKFTCNFKINTGGAFSLSHMHRVGKIWVVWTCTCSVRLNNISSSYCKCVLFTVLFSAIFFAFLVNSCSKWLPMIVLNCYAIAPKPHKLLSALWRRKYVLDKLLHSGMSYSAVGHVSNVNESIYIKLGVFKQTNF